MLDSAHAGFLVALAGDDGATGGLDNVFGKCLDGGLALHVNALEHIACIHFGRLECHR